MRLKVWLKNGVTMIAGTLAALLFIFFTVEMEAATLSTVYLGMFGAYMCGILNVNSYLYCLPLALSFGSSRREALIGTQLCRLFPTVVLTAVALILSMIAGEEGIFTPLNAVAFTMGVLLISTNVSVMSCMLYSRHGKKSLLFIIISIALIIMMFTYAFIVNVDYKTVYYFALLAVGILVQIIVFKYERKFIYEYNVKL